ncbi:MAG: ABC transporter permease [Acidimicrobiales bacterium]|nr:ABC transporter permease [Acidimicrobiales bacterium]
MTELTGEIAVRRWDHDYDSERSRPLLRHGYWPVLWSWARRDFRSRYSQSALRALWSIWQPLWIVLLNGAFFYGVLGVNGEGLPYLSFIVASILAFRYLATGLGACSIIFDNANIVTKAYFPREIIPLSTLVVSVVDVAAMLCILLVVATLQGISLSITLVALPLVLAVLVAFTVALTLFLCATAVFLRDLTYVVPLLSQTLFLGTPIMYPASQTPERIAWVNTVNPLAVVVEATRDCVLRHQWPNGSLLVVQLLINASLALLALRYVRALEPRMADVA